MTKNQLYVFIDESGDNSLNTCAHSSSHLFYLVAIVVNNQQKLIAEEKLDHISKTLNNGKEIKSSSIKSNNERRLKFLEAIKEIDFGYYGLIINKNKIYKDSGYEWKKTFYKTTTKHIIKKVESSSCDELLIYRDEIGSSDYMDSFASYFANDKISNNLFLTSKYSFKNSKESRLIQLADLIAGTFSYCFDENKKNKFSTDFRRILREKEFTIDIWPPKTISDTIIQSASNSTLDENIYNSLSSKAINYLIKLDNSNLEDDKMRYVVLNSLLFARIYEENKDQYFCSDRFIDILTKLGYEKLNKRAFTLKIMGEIRDAGIIITGTSSGYKLALSTDDINEYLSHNKNIIIPMVSRMKKAQDTIKTLTLNAYDILSKDELLNDIVGIVQDYQLNVEASHYEEDYENIDL